MRSKNWLVGNVMLWGGDDDDLCRAIWMSGINVQHVVVCGGITFCTVEQMVQFALRWHDHARADYDESQLRAFLLPPIRQLELDLDIVREMVEEMMLRKVVVQPVTYARVWFPDLAAVQTLNLKLAVLLAQRGIEHEITLDADEDVLASS